MSSKVIKGDESRAMALLESFEGATWIQIAAELMLSIDAGKAAKEKERRYINNWISRRFGKGEGKQVYSVRSSADGQWYYKRLQAMDEAELAQVREKEQKNLSRVQDKVRSIERRLMEIEILSRTPMLPYVVPPASAGQVAAAM